MTDTIDLVLALLIVLLQLVRIRGAFQRSAMTRRRPG